MAPALQFQQNCSLQRTWLPFLTTWQNKTPAAKLPGIGNFKPRIWQPAQSEKVNAVPDEPWKMSYVEPAEWEREEWHPPTHTHIHMSFAHR